MRIQEYHTYFVGCAEWGFSVWAHNTEYEIRTATRTEQDVAFGKSLTPRQAVLRLRRGQDVYVESKSVAKQLQKKASGGAIHDTQHGPGFLPHWHGGDRDTGHAFYPM